jgi:hypothetical protein
MQHPLSIERLKRQAMEVHHASSSSKALACFKSSVSKPSVKQPESGARKIVGLP